MAASASRSVENPQAPSQRVRECPTLPGDLRSLITHKIAPGQCQQRQREFYHKCHRCVYRGKPSDYVAEPRPMLSDVAENGYPIETVDLSELSELSELRGAD